MLLGLPGYIRHTLDVEGEVFAFHAHNIVVCSQEAEAVREVVPANRWHALAHDFGVPGCGSPLLDLDNII